MTMPKVLHDDRDVPVLMHRDEVPHARRDFLDQVSVGWYRLRTLVSNGDLDPYWRFHLAREYERFYPNRKQRTFTFTACSRASRAPQDSADLCRT